MHAMRMLHMLVTVRSAALLMDAESEMSWRQFMPGGVRSLSVAPWLQCVSDRGVAIHQICSRSDVSRCIAVTHTHI